MSGRSLENNAGKNGAAGAFRRGVSFVVPVRDSINEFRQCLEALSAFGRESELIVVDDSSTENIREIVERYGARYFRTRNRTGPAGARNLGAENAEGEIIVFVDADVIAPPDALRVITREFENDPQLAALFGSYDEAPAHSNFFSLFKNLMHHYVHQTSSEQAVTFWTGLGAVRKETFDAVGGFDALKYRRSSIEDIELGVRLTQVRQRIRLNKQLQVKHLKKWTLKLMIKSDIFDRAVPWTRLILQSGSIPADLNLSWSSRLSAVLVAFLSILAASLVCRVAGLVRWLPLRVSAVGLVSVIALLIFLNRGLYQFFWKRGGTKFGLRAVLVHWLYYFYSGITFVLCSVTQAISTGPPVPEKKTPVHCATPKGNMD